MNKNELNKIIIDNHIRIWFENQKNYNKYYNHLSKENYLKEFCIHKINTGRQSGHTKNSIELSLEYFDNIYYIVINSSHIKYMNENYKSSKINFTSFDKFTGTFLYGLKHNGNTCIILDVAGFYNKNKKDKFYETILKHFNNHTMIMELE